MKWAAESRVKAGVIAALFLLTANAVLSYRSTRALIESERLVTHTYQVLNELEAILATMTDAETGERGFIITGEERYLDPYHGAVMRVHAHVETLRRLTADNPRQQERIPLLRAKIQGHLDQLDEAIAVTRTGEVRNARQLIASGAGKQRMDDLRVLIAAMEKDENDLLRSRAVAAGGNARNAQITLIVSNLAAAILVFLVGYVILRGLAARRQAEQELGELLRREQSARADAEAANRAKDEFVAMISHEIRSPLTAVLGWAQMILSGTLEPDEARRATESILLNARAQAKLIEDLMDISRAITGKLRLNVQVLDPIPIIDDAIEAVTPAANAKAIRVEVKRPGTPSSISADADRLRQIVFNLLTNAVKFTPQDGWIDVVTERADGSLRITVADSGIGIESGFLPHVFDRFSQASTSTARRYSGLGLGLAIVQNLVELHGGSVTAQSAGEGKGATFTVNLPLKPSQPPSVYYEAHRP